MSTSVRRLYTELKPSTYELTIAPNAADLTFRGTVVITLKKTGRPSQRLTFHQHGLTIDTARIVYKDKKGVRELPVTRINNQNTLDEVRLHTDVMVYSGEYEVHMQFHGRITRNMTGLYPCFFKIDDVEHTLLATQFESHYARQMFPCIDEPEAKAVFTLSVIAPSKDTVLSNTPIAEEAPYNGELWQAAKGDVRRVTFQPTPRMSTYLLALAIGEMHRKSTTTERGTEVSVWGTIAQPAEAFDFALDAAKRSIEFFENYFGVPYPLPKSDHLALPDFSSGAMENWGLIVYRERLLLAYPNEAAQSTKEQIASVIAHEVSHQWFGNLVTMRWWDDLWLNESFANVMEYEAPAVMYPNWNVWDEFVANEGISALRRDAQQGVQAIKTEVYHPDVINTLFDPSIVYAKGGRLINMLKTYIGEDAFRKGLTAYFQRHAYGNTTGKDLWQALHESSGIDAGAFTDPWIEQSNFPVLVVEQAGTALTIRQQHFTESGTQPDGRLWPVPLFGARADIPARLDGAELHHSLTSDTYIRLNQGSAGHYIVHYANADHRAYIADLVRKGEMGVSDRLMLLNGASMLAKASYQTFGDALALLSAYQAEDNESVWGVISLILGETRRFIDLDNTLEPEIKSYIRTLIASQYRRLGWDEVPDESTSDQKLRGTIIALGVYAEDPEIVANALQRYAKYQEDPATINPELRSIVMGAAVRQNVAGTIEYLLGLHDNTNNADLRTDICAALTATEDVHTAEALLDRITNPELVKPQDADYWLFYLLRNRYTRAMAWDWMVGHWDWIVKTYGGDKSYDDFPRYTASACNTKEWAEKYEAFYVPKQSDITLERNIAIGLGEIRTRVQWLERDLAAVQAFFNGLKQSK
jgi:aminopeptidase N